MLLLSPYLKAVRPIAQKGLVPVLLGLLYLYLIVAYFGQVESGFSLYSARATVSSMGNLFFALYGSILVSNKNEPDICQAHLQIINL